MLVPKSFVEPLLAVTAPFEAGASEARPAAAAAVDPLLANLYQESET
jgi:hypothetical protein